MDLKAVTTLAKERFDVRRARAKVKQPASSFDPERQDRVADRLDGIGDKAGDLKDHGSKAELRRFINGGAGGARHRSTAGQKMALSVMPRPVLERLAGDVASNAKGAAELARADRDDNKMRVETHKDGSLKPIDRRDLKAQEQDIDLRLRALIRPELDLQADKPWVKNLLKRYSVDSIDKNKTLQGIIEDIMVVRLASEFTDDEHALPSDDRVPSGALRHLSVEVRDSLRDLDVEARVKDENLELVAPTTREVSLAGS